MGKTGFVETTVIIYFCMSGGNTMIKKIMFYLFVCFNRRHIVMPKSIVLDHGSSVSAFKKRGCSVLNFLGRKSRRSAQQIDGKAGKQRWVSLALLTLIALFSVPVFAASDGGYELSTIAANVTTTVVSLAKILTSIALIAGIGFVLASFFKFHQHKLNPTQVPISQGVTLLLIGAGLMLFPIMLPTAKNALFGKDASISKASGGDIANLIGGK